MVTASVDNGELVCIQVRHPDGTATREWAVIELQGSLMPVKETQTGLDGLKLGDLREEGDQYWLVIGNQRLAGKVEKLADPLAVFRKEVVSSGDAGASEISYSFGGVVSQRLLFKSRPSPNMFFKATA